MSGLVERVAHLLCPHIDGDTADGCCMKCSLSDKGPSGGVRGCIYHASIAARDVIPLILEEAAKVADKKAQEGCGCWCVGKATRALAERAGSQLEEIRRLGT